jgi:hypothetical protein
MVCVASSWTCGRPETYRQAPCRTADAREPVGRPTRLSNTGWAVGKSFILIPSLLAAAVHGNGAKQAVRLRELYSVIKFDPAAREDALAAAFGKLRIDDKAAWSDAVCRVVVRLDSLVNADVCRDPAREHQRDVRTVCRRRWPWAGCGLKNRPFKIWLLRAARPRTDTSVQCVPTTSLRGLPARTHAVCAPGR